MQTKAIIRKKYLQIRKNLTSDERCKKSQIITEKLEKLEVFQKAQHVLFYYTHDTEVDTVPLIQKYLQKKQLYLPVTSKDKIIHPIPINYPPKLTKGLYGIQEPVIEKNKLKNGYNDLIDLIIVPGIAFDNQGNRIGYGKGYYDRFLHQYHTTPKVALAFKEQMLDCIPKDPYDEAVDFIITE